MQRAANTVPATKTTGPHHSLRCDNENPIKKTHKEDRRGRILTSRGCLSFLYRSKIVHHDRSTCARMISGAAPPARSALSKDCASLSTVAASEPSRLANSSLAWPDKCSYISPSTLTVTETTCGMSSAPFVSTSAGLPSFDMTSVTTVSMWELIFKGCRPDAADRASHLALEVALDDFPLDQQALAARPANLVELF